MKQKIKHICIGLTALIAGILYSCDSKEILVESVLPSESGQETDQTEPQQESKESVFVYVCGQVQNPGVYELPGGARACEAVKAAGGMTKSAATESVNLATILIDGEKLYIPSMEENSSAIGEEAISSYDGKINLNTADKTLLMTLPGIGEARAEAVIAYRTQHGGFQDITEIMNISGIKQAAFDNIKDLISVSE